MRERDFFTLLRRDKKARAGVIKTAHGEVPTPVFMPVGTRGTVKAMDQRSLEDLGATILLGNAYHLYLRPGHGIVEKVGGGLHGFMSWDRPLLTDSGGFQVYSLSSLNRISEEGVEFRSHLDGSSHWMGPEKAMEVQRALGADITMAFDPCLALPAEKEELARGVALTLNWAKRCLGAPLRDYQHLFGIIQGGLHLDLRQECLEGLERLEGLEGLERRAFSGWALGGLSVGEKNEEMVAFCEAFVEKNMPQGKPRYLMGVGTPLDILAAVRAGIDMFDCVLPTRNARNGQIFTGLGPFNIKKECFKEDTAPPDPHCSCPTCERYTRAYLRHLYTTGETLAAQLITRHNLHFYLDLMKKIRQAILKGVFDDFYRTFYNEYSSGRWK